MTSFNFGPIARTEAGNTRDTINLASFPLHVMLNALVGSTSVEEFIAWLWHDLYKPAFYWKKGGWYHVPGVGAFTKGETVFANLTKIPIGLVSSHHPRLVRPYHPLWDRKTEKLVDPSTNLPCPKFKLLESDFISDQSDQVNLGATVNYIQLSFAAEPALPTLLTRSVIADTFYSRDDKRRCESSKQSSKSALDGERAEQIAKVCKETGKSAYVYAPQKFVSQKELTGMGITFCQLPYNIHRIADM